MYLLSLNQSNGIDIRDFPDDETRPKYAIVSHTWQDKEVSFADLRNGREKRKGGYEKLLFGAHQARKDGIEFFWMGSCCINKTSSSEFSEAINSMFRWCQNSSKCYVLLADVSSPAANSSRPIETNWEKSFRSSRWFKRGWTLQELLAPPIVEFFSAAGQFLGSKYTLSQQIHEITGIPSAALHGQPLSQFSVEERMRWIKPRTTLSREDRAYCLLGIFNVHMPILYGEGEAKAFARLNREISQRPLLPKPAQPRTRTAKEASVPSTTLPPRLQYDSLAPSGFRLLTLNPGKMGESITGHLQEYSLTNPPNYYALSYVWGQEPPLHRTIINDGEHFIQPNLFHALQRIRHPDGQYSIWVDTLCINQKDVSERNVQVREMATIYGSASGVLIWLGEEDSTSSLALDFVSKVTSDKFRWGDLWWEEYGLAALAQVLQRTWFRRGWVLQEAAFSKNSTIRCGDREIHMDHFATAVRAIRDRLGTIPLSSSQVLTNFHDSPAIRLLDTITSALRTSAKTEISRRRLSLEALIYQSTYSETIDQRDAIYSLLNLANDAMSTSGTDQGDSITPDYTKPVLDVFVDFVQHCCLRSGHLDIICRPWAPISSTSMKASTKYNQTESTLQIYPSWIVTKDKLPFGYPSWQSQHRLHGIPLVSRANLRCYFTHYGSRPQVSIGRNEDGSCNGVLQARGFILGEMVERSARMADAIITKECIDILRSVSFKSETDLTELLDPIWRTLCADRDVKGERAPYVYQQAMLHIIKICSRNSQPGSTTSDMLDQISSIDPEELLDAGLPEYVEQFLTVIRDVAWNRRTFRMKTSNHGEQYLVGLAPQRAKIGDYVCVLYGCSVPVILRDLHDTDAKPNWTLIGDAYVHTIMDGEAISRSAPETLRSSEVDFRIV